MDIKTLYDAGCDANVNWENEDCVRDLEAIWIATALTNPEWISENLDDLVASIRVEDLRDACTATAQAMQDRDYIVWHTRKSSGLLVDTYCNAMVGRLNRIGSIFAGAIQAAATQDVKANLWDWFTECQAYHHDMMQGRYEDSQVKRIKEMGE